MGGDDASRAIRIARDVKSRNCVHPRFVFRNWPARKKNELVFSRYGQRRTGAEHGARRSLAAGRREDWKTHSAFLRLDEAGGDVRIFSTFFGNRGVDSAAAFDSASHRRRP